MNKFAIIGIAALLAASPLSLAACNRGENPVADEPVLIAPDPAQDLPDRTEGLESEPKIQPEDPLPAEPEERVELPAAPAIPAKTQYVYVNTNGLNVRSGAGTSYSSLGQVERNVLLKYGGTEGGWYRTYYRGREAYVSAKAEYTALTALDEGSELCEKVIEEGLRVLGTPYVYGATRLHDGKGNLLKGFSAEKFDCSSLMQYIFYKGAGINLDMNTRTQIKQGAKVASNDLRRGDLMFFTNASRYYNTGIERVGHVALYLGDNYILHTASDYAKVEQISATRWSYFIEARRVF